MKVLVIPDVHLKPWMFERAEEIMKKKMAERAVCLMDIPDDWNQEYNLELYRDTFDAAIAFAKKYPDTLWCYGNHDLSYLWNKRESGYSPAAAYTVAKKLDELACALPEGNEIRYVQKIDQVLFCHGGILDYFVRNLRQAMTMWMRWSGASMACPGNTCGIISLPYGTGPRNQRSVCTSLRSFCRWWDIPRWSG